MELNINSQNSHQNATSTTMWTQPKTEEQKRYYSKHSPKRRVYGWIMTLLQTAHGFLAFAAWTAIYIWVFNNMPQLQWLSPVLSISTLFALHILFRTTWETFWYDRLDDDPNTDSSVFIPAAIIVLLLIAEVNGASKYLASQVKDPERRGTVEIDQSHQSTIASLDASYDRDKNEILAIYRDKERAAAAPYNRKIVNLESKGESAKSLKAQRDQAVNAVKAEKANQLQVLFSNYSSNKQSASTRKESILAEVDNHNANEAQRYTSELGEVGTYAWVLSVALLSLIAGLGYARVRINVKSGILPDRNYTVLDAHGSVVERFATAIGDAFNRRTLQLSVWLHKALSPNHAITSFDGTVVSRPGTYNTPQGKHTLAPTLPQATDEEAVLRSKVAEKIMREAAAAEITITPQLLENELLLAKTLNGTYFSTPLGKHEPSPVSAQPEEGKREDAPEVSFARMIENWRNRLLSALYQYDTLILSGDTTGAKEYQDYINDPFGPIMKEASRLGIRFGIIPPNPEIQVWRIEKSAHKVDLSKLTEQALFDYKKGLSKDTAADELEDLFKCDLNTFKDTVVPNYDDEMNVIGVKYKKDLGGWATIGLSQIRSRLKIQEEYCKKPGASDKAKQALEKWRYALHLVTNNEKSSTADLSAVTID